MKIRSWSRMDVKLSGLVGCWDARDHATGFVSIITARRLMSSEEGMEKRSL